MARRCLGLLVILLSVNCARSADGLDTLEDGYVHTISLKNLRNQDAHVQRMALGASSRLKFNVTSVPPEITFIIFEIHTYQYNVTLSYDQMDLDKVLNRSVFGSNIGLYINTTSAKSVQTFLKNENVRTVEAMLAVVLYDDRAPVPGGCNMEFDTEIAPYEKLLLDEAMITVDIQPASPSTFYHGSCEKNPTRYAIYQAYLPEQDFSPQTYFAALQKVLTVGGVLSNADKMPAGSSPMRHVHSAYIGVGSIYVGVATYGNMSAYVPVFSYACSPVLYPGTCQLPNDAFSKLALTFIFFLGFFSILKLKMCPRLGTCLPPFFVGSVVGNAIALRAADYSNATNVVIATTTGLSLWILSLIVAYASPVMEQLIYRCLSAFFITCIIYFGSLDRIAYLESEWVFWTVFGLIMLSFSLLLFPFCTVSVRLAVALFSSYMMILPIDYWIGSCLKYIVINFTRRAVVPEFSKAVIHPPFQHKDTILTIVWCCLFVYLLATHCAPHGLCTHDLAGALSHYRRTGTEGSVADERTMLIPEHSTVIHVRAPGHNPRSCRSKSSKGYKRYRNRYRFYDGLR